MKKIGIIVATCFAFALCFALVGCGSVDKKLYTGTWDLESGSDENLSSDSIELMKSLGLEVTMTLNEDGTGSMSLFGEAMALKWEAKSNTEGTVTFDGGNTAAMKLANGKLTLEDSTGSSMTFTKAETAASASAAASSGAASSASAASANSEAASSASAASASSEAASSASAEAASSEAASSEAASSSASAEAASGSSASEEASSSAAA